ncbi:MAG: type transport system permease protein [Verrucomicrobiota bacterium]
MKLQRHTRRQHPLWQLSVMRWRIFVREPSALFWTYGFPVVLALALGVAFRNRPPEPVEVAVEAMPGSEAWRDALATNSQVHVRWLNPREAREALRVGKVSVVVGRQEPLLLEPRSSRREEAHSNSGKESQSLLMSAATGLPRIYQFDPTRPESRMARAVVDDALQRAEGRVDPTLVQDQIVTEPGSRYIDFLIPGLLGFNLMSSGLWGVGFVIVEMRVRKLIKRMMATPMSRAHFLLSFVLVRGAFLLGELPILLCFAHWVFNVPIRGSVPLIVGLSILGSLMFAGMGLLIGSRAQNTHTVAGLVNATTLPMLVTSGVFFSAARFPEVVQPIIRLLPLTALIEAVRTVMLDGAGVAAVASQIGIMLAWGLISFVVALWIFRWQ